MSLDSPEETRPFEAGAGQLQLVDMKEGGVGRATFLPGLEVVTAREADRRDGQLPGCPYGLLHFRPDECCHGRWGRDGVRPREFRHHAPGHDAWVVGGEPCVVIDWQGFADYAKR